jgi:hypothetical protein
MFSSMNVAFHIMFFTAGVLFGLGFVAVLSRRAAQQRHAPDAPPRTLSSTLNVGAGDAER